jgi:hypothetical protein
MTSKPHWAITSRTPATSTSTTVAGRSNRALRDDSANSTASQNAGPGRPVSGSNQVPGSAVSISTIDTAA